MTSSVDLYLSPHYGYPFVGFVGQALETIITLGMFAGLAWLVVRASPALTRRIWAAAFTVVVGGTITMMVTHSFVAKWAFKGDNPRDGLMHMMDGSAARPYVYRRLVPDIILVTTDAVVPRLSTSAATYLVERSPLMRYRWVWGVTETWTERKAFAFHVAYFLTWAAWFGTFLSGAALHRAIRDCSWFEAIVTAFIIIALVPLTLSGGGYVYDAPELLLWTLLLLAAMRKRFWLVVPLFGLMMMNKESALLAVPALFPIFRHGMKRGAAAMLTALLGAIGIAWLLFVRAKFAGQPGQPTEWWLPSNLAFWSRPTSYFLYASEASPALPSPRSANIVNLILLLVPLRAGWHFVRPDLRRATLILAAVVFPLFLLYGYRDEIRALSLLDPFVALAAVEGVSAMFQIGMRRESADAPAAADQVPKAAE